MSLRPGPRVGARSVLPHQEPHQPHVVPLDGLVEGVEAGQMTGSAGEARLRRESLPDGLQVSPTEGQQPGSPRLAPLPLAPREGPHGAPLLGRHHTD